MCQNQDLAWFWLAIIHHFLWWLLPEEVGLALAAISLAAGFIAYLLLDVFAPQEPLPYVPKKRCKHAYHFAFPILHAMNLCATSVMTRISNMKDQRHNRPPGLRYSGHRHRRKKGKPILNATITGMTTTWSGEQTPSLGMFDSDLQALMLDDGASACITNDKEDFIELPKRVDRKVKGIKGHANATHRGTLKWHIEDDQGLVHVMVIRGAYLIPDVATRILSPQQLAQQADDHYPMEEGTGALTTSKNITLFWAQRRFTKTVPNDTKMNVGLTTTASGAHSFRAFCATINVPETKQTNIFTMHIIQDEDDEESFQPKDSIEPPILDAEGPEYLEPKHNKAMTQGQPQTTLVDLGPITCVIPEDQEPTSLDPHNELLQWHYRLGHLSFERILQLACSGQLPKRLLTCKKPSVWHASMVR